MTGGPPDVEALRATWRIAIFTALIIGIPPGCEEKPAGPSSSSVAQSKSRGLFVAGYATTSDATLGEYRLIKAWVERHPESGENRLIVRLAGPHVDTEPRVAVIGLDETAYRTCWSAGGRPPYEVWLAPNPTPAVITFERGGKEVSARRYGP